MLEIIEDKENSLLNRREAKVLVEAVKNPSFPEVSKMLSENFKTSEEAIAVKKIEGRFGRNNFLISALIYKTKEDKEKIERKKKVKVAQQAAGS